MPRTLIVNCYLESRRSEALVKAVGNFSDYSVVSFREIGESFAVGKDMDAVVLSGSAARIVNDSHRTMFQGVINLIRSCGLPILGICFGHQSLCWAFGAKVGSLNQPVLDKFEKVRIIETDGLFSGLSQQGTAVFAESHYDYVLKESLDPAGFVLLADSSSCEVEAVKHRHGPFYGVQFHPERLTVNGEFHSDGLEVFENFYNQAVVR